MAELAGPVFFREMTEEDLDAVMAIAGESGTAPQWGREAYRTAIGDGAVAATGLRRVAMVGEILGRVCGFAVGSLVAGVAEIETVAVAAEFQRLGVGGVLLMMLLRALRRAGADEVVLEVRASNLAGLGLYRWAGFQETGRRRRYYSRPVEDAVLLRLGLVS